ncbi:MAG: peptide chain release factor 1 [Desulfobacteraceae bacterium]|nr:peptide chain release factor 1 [Desulfobacteraceae bacterium]
MFERLEGIEKRYYELEHLLSDPAVVGDRERYPKYVREHAELGKIVGTYSEYRRVNQELEQSRELLSDSDSEIKELAKSEIDSLEQQRAELEKELKKLLIPKDPNDEKNVIIEIRAGTGGEEASLFAGDLFRMYSRYSESKGWKIELIDAHWTDSGGAKEVVAMVRGQGAYSHLKYESGTHRVQRVPATEAQGRIHTSAVTVAVLAEAEDVEVQIDPNDVEVDVFRSSGPGGQSVNTTDSAVRLTHTPSGLVVTCQDEKSQHKNKAKAMKVLRARLYDIQVREQNEKITQERRSQVGSGDRSERIRTYNFPQSRITDHRIGLTLYKLEQVLQGELDEIIDELAASYQARALQNAESQVAETAGMDRS